MLLETTDDVLAVGRFGRVYGVNGWITVHSLTQQLDCLASYHPWLMQQDHCFAVIELADKKLLDNKLRVRLANCQTVNQAQRYVNKTIYVKKTALPILPKDEYYWYQLIGLEVFGLDGYLGKVQELFSAGAHDILVVTNNSKRHLIPYVDAIVKRVLLLEKRIEVLWASDY